MSNIIFHDGKLEMDWEYAILLTRVSGLRSKRKRHVRKRLKKIIYDSLEEYIGR